MKFNIVPALWKELWALFGAYKRQAFYVLIMVIISSFLEAVSIGLLMPILDLIINEDTNSVLGNALLLFFGEISPEKSLVIVLIMFFFFILLKNIFVLIKIRMHGMFSFGMRGYWMSQLMRKYIEADYNYIINKQHGSLVNNILVESEKSQACLKYIIQFVSSFLLTLFMVLVMLITSWQITLYFILVVGVVVTLSNRTVNAYSDQVGIDKLKYAHSVSTALSEGLSLIRQIKILGIESRVTNDFAQTIKKYIKTLSDFFLLSRLPSRVAEVLNVGLIVSSIVYILVFTELSLKELVPMIAVFVVIGNRISLQVGQLINSKMEILSNLKSLRTIDSLINDKIKTEEINKGLVCKSLQGDIEFKNVEFSYEKNNSIFENLNFTIPKGAFVFLIGGSGSGKSCLVDLLLRFQQPVSGEVKFNGSNIDSFSKISWRKRIGYVSQDVMLFNKTIRENILDGNLNATEYEIETVLKQVNALDFVRSLPDGLDTIVGDRGVKLSGGQRQRIALARALVRDVDFLILDEATSALDQKLEKEVIDNLKQERNNKTILFITHRLFTTNNADIIFELSEGVIAKVSRSLEK